MNYVISDIHGYYNQFVEILDLIKLKDTDTLYVLGDVVDRGPNPIKTLLKLMEMSNVVCIVGNHELMALDGLRFFNTEITTTSVDSIDVELLGNLIDWQRNGSASTIEEFKSLDQELRNEILNFIVDFSMYEELIINGQKYLLVHAGLGEYSPQKTIEDYSLKNLVWDRANYNIQYFEDTIVVTGHTPTQFIEGNQNPGRIYKNLNHIAIDCGCGMPDGRLAAICLETGEEFYSSKYI
ncbi:serine/threonine protein phosphatase 1 [Pseudobutyrivibrio sp. C4]|uniref:metallophosphoesterase n=1 Tax=Pseudobutyrivibrio sp. C4 TaxID=1520803 RepID=UPI0008CDDAA5|nr:metallophosphoesterase [Pseudobutyrivibrio sp. C4]SES94027.1 serine/threonine protein phosphatase 1 [Pseudobutyrivibrio sp. C4]